MTPVLLCPTILSQRFGHLEPVRNPCKQTRKYLSFPPVSSHYREDGNPLTIFFLVLSIYYKYFWIFNHGKTIGVGGNFDLTEINDFLGFAKNPQIQIAVISGVKMGKSSLLNALFGSEITSVDVIPETACLSVFRLCIHMP